MILLPICFFIFGTSFAKLILTTEKQLDGFIPIAKFSNKFTYIVDDSINISNDFTFLENDHVYNLDYTENNDIVRTSTNTINKLLYNGEGVYVYIIDSGVKNDIEEYGNRIIEGVSFVPFDNTTTDCLGHGTHVTSIIGSKSYGIANSVFIVPIRVFGCSKTTNLSTVLNGIYWILSNKMPKGIVNLSLNLKFSDTMNNYVNELINNGHIVVTSAGNDNDDACKYVTGKKSIVTGCVDSKGNVCSFSNYGECVSVYAPGIDIYGLGLYYTHTIKKSGTSMSAPYVTSIAAMLKQRYPTINNHITKNTIVAHSINNIAQLYNDIGPGCSTCKNRPLCKHINNKYGCRVFSFCGFKLKRECINRKRCKYINRKCIHR